MGCSGSKAGSSKAAKKAPKEVLLGSQGLSDGEFMIVLDRPIGTHEATSGLVATDDGSALRVESIKGGSLGHWNNRPWTEKLLLGDLLMPESGNATSLLEALCATGGPLKVKARRAKPDPVKQEAPTEEAQTTEAKTSPVAEVPTDAEPTSQEKESEAAPPVAQPAQDSEVEEKGAEADKSKEIVAKGDDTVAETEMENSAPCKSCKFFSCM
jgi:hypothetical protein